MNEHNDVVMIELDRPRPLKLSHLVMKRFSAATKMPIVDFETAGTRYDYISELVYFMLNHDDPKLSRQRCDELLEQVSIGYVIGKCSEAINAAFGEPEEAPEEVPQTAAGTGIEA